MTTSLQTEAMDILKSAILLEMRGRAFYSEVARQSKSEAAREFFGYMAQEEEAHIEQLSAQYRSLQKGGSFVPLELAGASTHVADDVLTDRLRTEIHAASYEAAAIGAAISMEKNAVDLYSKRMSSASHSDERALYAWLTTWEQEHLSKLVDLDRKIQQDIWFDNKFWPM